MARVRYLGHEPVTVPELGDRTVQPDEVVDVPDDRYEGYVCQPANWEAVEEPRPPAQGMPELPTRKSAARTVKGVED
ncbi:hypothetical protein ACF09I_34575 [Streptomyces sp. NPDC014940]|uniref:hypothetical protein n=1 Tax=Streptomyces sp. NPDC014940 TaxID=3364932 RepID=UPI0037034A1C